MWFTKTKIKNSLTESLANDPSLSIFGVLSNPDLFNSIRSEISELIAFLVAETNGEWQNLEILYKLALSDELNSDEIDYRYNRNAANVLSASCRSFQTRCCQIPSTEKPKICEYLINFMKSKYARNSTFSGHFQRIFMSFVSFTQGKFALFFPDFMEFLIRNLDILSYQQILSQMISDYPSYLNDQKSSGKNIFLYLSEKVADMSNLTISHHIVAALLGVSAEKRNEFSELQEPKILSNILTACEKAENDSLFMFDVTRLANLIVGSIRDWASEVISSFYHKFKFDVNYPTNKMIQIFPVFVDLALDEMIPLFFWDEEKSETENIKLFNNQNLHSSYNTSNNSNNTPKTYENVNILNNFDDNNIKSNCKESNCEDFEGKMNKNAKIRRMIDVNSNIFLKSKSENEIYLENNLNSNFNFQFSQTDLTEEKLLNKIHICSNFINCVLTELYNMEKDGKIEELSKFVDRNQIVRKIIDSYNSQLYDKNYVAGTNGHIAALAIFLFRVEWKEFKPKTLIKNREWDIYIVTIILPRIKIFDVVKNKPDNFYDTESDSSSD